MATATLDTLTTVKRLREAGVPEGQAEAWVTIWRDQREFDLAQLATKADLDQLEQRISAMFTGSQNAALVKWLVPLPNGQAALTAALVKLL